MSDISRPGYRAVRAIAEYAACYGRGESEARIRELVAQGIAEVRANLSEKEIIDEVLELMTDPDGW